MERDVKIGIAIGVLLIALVAVFMWTRRDVPELLMPPGYETSRAQLPAAEEPVAPLDLGAEADLLSPSEISASEVPMPRRPDLPGRIGGTSFQPLPGVPTSVGTAPARQEAPAPAEPLSASVPPTVTPAASEPVIYAVQRGDTLIRIARKHYEDGRKWQIILDANKDKITRAVDIRPGMKLTIPSISKTSTLVPVTIRTAPPEMTTQKKHTVAKGEVLSKIAARYYGTGSKTNIDRIYNKNKSVIGSDPNKLKVGMVLTIPPKN